MRFSKLLLLLSLSSPLAACGTIISSPTQEITLFTPGAWDAQCTLDNGTKYRMVTNETRRIQRTYKPLEIECYAPGNRYAAKTVGSGLNEWTYANVSNGIIPGVAYDAAASGLYEYPDRITVDFVGVPMRGFELPDYHNKDVPSPYDQSIEDYGASTARIPYDNSYMKRGVEKRDMSADTNPFASKPTAPPVTAMPPLSRPSVSAPGAKGSSAEELNRSMNPTVFNN